ncbi:MAG TPA: DUF3048 domain-containing protein [Mobilitalea sp.]|nr:DUF3048 domain-containing protein [Mobilitalea sp.]
MLSAFVLFGCKKKNNSNNDGIIQDYNGDGNLATTAPTQAQVTIAPDTNHAGEMKSYFTGQWVPEDIGKKRPIAFVFNNINLSYVRNQSGIEQADILYEALVEGGITRLLGISQNFTGDRIGSVRSARHYFVSIADEYDAIYIHYGRTKYAVSKMKELGIDHIDGLDGIGNVVFYRDNSIKAPHNAFASAKGIAEGIKEKGFETQLPSDYQPHFNFYDADTDLTSDTNVNKITLKFSTYASQYFEYNSTDKLYYRFQYGVPHKDSVTGNQLKFKNIIVQFVKEWNIDKKGYQTMDLTDASGKGYLISNGKMVPITWKKKEANKWMRYYNEAGEELTINPGKTYVALFPDNRTKDVVIE